MFVRTNKGEAYPVERVERIWRENGPNNTIDGYAEIKNVGRVRLWYGEYERIFSGDVTFVQANPGWKTLERFEDEDGYELLENDVVSWAVYADGGILPVTIEGVDCGESQWEGYVRPDGKIVDKSGLKEFERTEFYKPRK